MISYGNYMPLRAHEDFGVVDAGQILIKGFDHFLSFHKWAGSP
jgi:hypothetical protein